MAPRARRAPERALRASRFGDWLVTFHPDLPGEVKGKSSNLAWAARRVEDELIATGRLDAAQPAGDRVRRRLAPRSPVPGRARPRRAVAPGRPPAHLPAGDPVLRQPLRGCRAAARGQQHLLAVLAGAIGGQPSPGAPVDVLADAGGPRAGSASGTSTSSPKTRTCSSRCWLHLGQARARRAPIYLPVYADAAEGATLRAHGRREPYQQIRRWAWGVSDIPYLALRALRARHIPWHMRVMRVGWYVEEHLVWPSHWFLLTLGGLVPPLLNPGYARTALGVWQTRHVFDAARAVPAVAGAGDRWPTCC